MTYSLKVVEIRTETNDTITLTFKQPALKRIKYLSGQYLTLIFRINGRRYLRPYSFSSSPITDAFLEVTIKRILNGVVSNHIHDMVKIGDTVETLPPMGEFILNQEHEKNSVFLWGGGSGITPLISIAKSALWGGNSLVKLIYCNQNFETTIFKDQISLLEENFPDRFSCTHFHSRSEIAEKSNIIYTRINAADVANILSKYDSSKAVHYICGPAGLKKSITVILKNLNISSKYIYFEDFETIKDPENFADIISRKVEIHFQGKKNQLEVVRGKSILEAALDMDIEIPYSCQTGNCDTCKATLISGELKILGNAKERDDLNKNEVLLCSSYPLSDNIQLHV